MTKRYTYKQTSQRSPRLRRNVKIALLVMLVILIAGAAWAYHSHTNKTTTDPVKPTNTVDYNPPSEKEKAAAAKQKDEIIEKATSKPGTNTDENGVSSGTITLTITRASSGSNTQPVSIGTLISGTNTGTCSVTFSKAGQASFQKDFPVVFEATSSRCDNVVIPSSEFAASGEWNVSIIAKNGTATSSAATQKVMVTK